MKAISDFEPYLQVILKRMCDVVEADPAKIDFGQATWYMEHEWSRDQENAFTSWLTQYFISNAGARKELLVNHTVRTKKYCRKAAGEFVWNHGWKTKKNEKEKIF